MISRLIAIFWQWWYRHHSTPSHFTKDEVLKIAHNYNLEAEVIEAMKHGCSPDEALQEWDIYPYNENNFAQ